MPRFICIQGKNLPPICKMMEYKARWYGPEEMGVGRVKAHCKELNIDPGAYEMYVMSPRKGVPPEYWGIIDTQGLELENQWGEICP